MSKRHDSEDEDNPDPFQSSGEEWDMEKEEAGRRKSSRLSTKPKRKIVDSGSESDGSDSSTDNKRRKRPAKTTKNKTGSAKKKTKVQVEEEEDAEEEDEDDDEFRESASNYSGSESDSSKKNVTVVTNSHSKGIQRKFIPKTIFSEDYATGSFVILKKDAQGVEPSQHPSIWRIDGKALLQKYEAFDEDGKVRHKNTSIYTGWSTLDKDLYAPITVDVVKHNNNNLTVELHWDKLKTINFDSD